jgi:hypothetical protein
MICGSVSILEGNQSENPHHESGLALFESWSKHMQSATTSSFKHTNDEKSAAGPVTSSMKPYKSLLARQVDLTKLGDELQRHLNFRKTNVDPNGRSARTVPFGDSQPGWGGYGET